MNLHRLLDSPGDQRAATVQCTTLDPECSCANVAPRYRLPQQLAEWGLVKLQEPPTLLTNLGHSQSDH